MSVYKPLGLKPIVDGILDAMFNKKYTTKKND